MTYEKTSLRSCLRWKSTGKFFTTVGLKWIPIGKLFDSCKSKVSSEPPNGSNDDITNPYACDQTLNVSEGTLNLSAGMPFNLIKERLRVWFPKRLISHKPRVQWILIRCTLTMMSVHISSGLALHQQMASADNTSGLAPQRKESIPLLTRIDQDTPSTSTSQTIKEAQSHVIPTSFEEDDHESSSPSKKISGATLATLGTAVVGLPLLQPLMHKPPHPHFHLHLYRRSTNITSPSSSTRHYHRHPHDIIVIHTTTATSSPPHYHRRQPVIITTILATHHHHLPVATQGCVGFDNNTATGFENHPPMLNKENYVLWSSRLFRYAKSRPNGKLIHNSIINGAYVRRMIPEPGDTNREVPTILLGLLEDIYAAVDSCETAQEIWLRVQQMMKGSGIGIQEKKAKLFNDWERFSSNDGESIESNYHLLNQDQPLFNQNYMQQPMPNLEDIIDPTTAMNMELALMAKASKLNYSTPTNNNQRISSNPSIRQIAQPGNLNRYNAVQNVKNQVVPGNANQNPNENGNLIVAVAKGNAAGHNGNQIWCYNYGGVGHFARNCTVRPRRRDISYLQTQLLIAQKEETGIQLQAEEFDLMAAAADLDEIKKVNVNYILMANLHQSLTSDISKTANVSKPISTLNEEFSDDTTPSAAHKFLNEVKSTIVTLQRVVKHRMSIETHNWSSFAHKELHKIVKDENFPIVNQVDARVQNFEIQFLKEATKFVGDFKSLVKEADESLAKHKALEFEIERLLKAVVSHDIMTVVQNNSVVDTSNLQTKLERTKERFENCIIKKQNEYAKLWNDWYTKCKECKFDKISYDKAYNDMQQKIERLQLSWEISRVIAPGMFRINPFKTSREEKHVPNIVRPSTKTKPITILQPPVFTKKDVNSDSNGLSSTGIDNTKTRRLQPMSNTNIDRVPSASKSSCNKNKEVEVEKHHRNLLFSKNKKHMSSACNNIKIDSQNVKSKVVYAMSKQCLISINHDVKKTKKVGFIERLATLKTSKPRSFLWWSPTGRMFDLKGKIIASSESESQSDCSNGDNACTCNPLEPKIKRFPNSTCFLGRLSKFVHGASTRVYYVEGLGHNLFSVGQFCDSDLEVAFRRNACFLRNLEGVDLLSGIHTTNLYTINLHDMAYASPICLMARASSTKSWL
uniref:Integrase, catalytic region, zinc finger, CCHC-type, peptidase aspartic, catalytic n=1 Tax=Tanacetum cinerariifolium TaxID=118510 RepID=A0A6L2NQ93_TANCI|nr:integrase, catalytic region, zinc finger, CCHC-type, peptidase aspartic, catalytic [Tanacetum cinerariifolium]